MTLPWHARNHQDALDGMLMLTLEERGAYNTVLDLIYSRAAAIPDDARWLSGWMGVSMRRWTTIRASLIVKAKIYAVNVNGVDCLMNRRAADEIEAAAERRRNLAESGAKGGRKRAENEAKSNENNASDQAPLKLLTETVTEQEETPTEPNGSAAPPKSKPKPKPIRSRICPADWSPSDGDMAVAAGEGFTPGEIERELAKFRDYEFRDPHSDWSRAFRGWMRKAADHKPRRAHERPHHDAKFEARHANFASAFEGAERAAGRRFEP